MKRTVLAGIFLAMAVVAGAETRPVTTSAVFTFNGREIAISRASVSSEISGVALAQSSDACDEPCLTPMTAAANISTFGEMDVIAFMSSDVGSGRGLLIDARPPSDRAAGIIPASVNIPVATISPSNPYRDEILMALGAEQFQSEFDFSGALSLVVYDAGPATQDAPALITNLLAAGYPPEKIAYYRGGVLVWFALGLSTQGPAQ